MRYSLRSFATFRSPGSCLGIALVLALIAILPAAVNAADFRVKRVAVECNGSCSDATLANLCGSGWTPIAVDCADVQEPSASSACGGNNRCFSTVVTPTQTLVPTAMT